MCLGQKKEKSVFGPQLKLRIGKGNVTICLKSGKEITAEVVGVSDGGMVILKNGPSHMPSNIHLDPSEVAYISF